MSALTSPRTFTGVERAAVLMMLVGDDEAAAILQKLDPEEVRNLGSAMFAVADVSEEEVDNVLDDFVGRARDRTGITFDPGRKVESVMTRALGPEKAESVLARITPTEAVCEIDLLDWLDASEIELRSVMGQGRFGKVRRARYKGKDVAVKQLIGDVGKRELAEFEDEAKRMKKVPPHPNLVEFYGVTEIDGMPAVVTMLCTHGCLSDALYGVDPLGWSERQLMRVAAGSAAGLAHLHKYNIVHRDIAARNVLLHRGRQAKVTDFGLSRSLDEGQESNFTKTEVGPVRWMAPEEMEKQRYSFKSDVFAFGVLVYEIYAQEVPWGELNNVKVARLVMAGKRLKLTDKIPAQIRELMRDCWLHSPKARPSMRHCAQRLKDMLPDDESL